MPGPIEGAALVGRRTEARFVDRLRSRLFGEIKPWSDCNPRPGDTVACAGHYLSSGLISLVTAGLPFWSPSHVGMIDEHDGELFVFHSTTDDSRPCAIRGQKIRGTQAIRLADFVQAYRGKIWHYPLTFPLYDHERARLSASLLAHLGLPYDRTGAGRSAGGMLLMALKCLWSRENIARLYCSEFDAYELIHIGRLRADNASLYSPALLIRLGRLCRVFARPNRWK